MWTGGACCGEAGPGWGPPAAACCRYLVQSRTNREQNYIEGRGCGTIGVIKSTAHGMHQELGSCVNVEMAVLGSPSQMALVVSVRKAANKQKKASGHQCVKVDMAVSGSPSPISRVVSVDIKQQ